LLRHEFPPVSPAEWEAAIQADLNDADYGKKLFWRTEDGIPVRPYYTREDLIGLEAQTLPEPGAFPFTRGPGSQDWEINEPGTEPVPDAIRADRIQEAGGTAVQELGYAIAEGVERLTGSANVDDAAGSIRFVFAVGSNFFFEIAKLRAARMLWARAVSAFEPKQASSGRMKIDARTALSNKSIYDPYTNLLRVTTEALSAAIGGCDSLTVTPFRFPDRLALNVQRILKEESHLHRVADPAGGSYYVEALTDALAREGWKLFQKVEAEGGYAKAGPSIKTAIDAARAAKEAAVASRRRTLVGVNNYPNAEETSSGAPLDMPGEIWRAAEAFENIRLRTEAHAAAAGRRPSILLLVRGDAKMRTARAQFCRNLFGCGGFAIDESDDYIHTGADAIILCSSDPEYLALAHEVCPKVNQPVIVAGHPKDQIEALRAAGVVDFVHISRNAIEVLTDWQRRFGIGGAE
jgi:methylmalonyl-CoA mutase